MLVPVAVVLVAVLVVMAWRAPSTGRAAILGLILGGALGNLADRFFRDDHGAVVDFVALHFWPTFNVADASHRGGLRPAARLPGAGAAARRDRADGDGAGLTRRGPGGQGGGPGGRPVPLDGQRPGRRGPGPDRRGHRPQPEHGPPAAARSSRSTGTRSRPRAGPAGDPGGRASRWSTRTADMIVVDKPAGLVVHPGAGSSDRDPGPRPAGPVPRPRRPCPARSGSDPERPGIVHRLDRGTSGLMVVARTPAAYRSLVDQLGRRDR